MSVETQSKLGDDSTDNSVFNCETAVVVLWGVAKFSPFPLGVVCGEFDSMEVLQAAVPNKINNSSSLRTVIPPLISLTPIVCNIVLLSDYNRAVTIF